VSMTPAPRSGYRLPPRTDAAVDWRARAGVTAFGCKGPCPVCDGRVPDEPQPAQPATEESVELLLRAMDAAGSVRLLELLAPSTDD
jgi:hypothetical protein